MTTKVKSTLTAFAWDAGENPAAVTGDDENLQYALMERLGTKEYGRFTRSYPTTEHAQGGELTLLYRAFDDPFRGRQIVSGLDEQKLAESYDSRKRECSLRVFTPAELYALKPVSVDYASYSTVSVHLTDDFNYYWDIDLGKVADTKRMETRTLVDHDYDGRRGWTLQTVWFDSKPVMVVNSSGRDGDEYHERWITDGAAFHALVSFLKSFLPEGPSEGFVEASAKIPAMTEFYGHTIHDYYDVDAQEPKKL